MKTSQPHAFTSFLLETIFKGKNPQLSWTRQSKPHRRGQRNYRDSQTVSTDYGIYAKHDNLTQLSQTPGFRNAQSCTPPIPSPFAGAQAQKVIYVSSKTPFISAVKRVRKLLAQIDKLSRGRIDLVDGKASDKAKIIATGRKEGGKPEAVLLKGTGKAIEKVLSLGLFFQGQEDCRVTLTTGSVGAVDDIVEGPQKGKKRKRKGGGGANGSADTKRDNGDNVMVEAGVEDNTVPEPKQEQELPECQLRMMSVVEVSVSLR